MLYFKASVVNWKDIRPWRPSSGLKEALFCGYSNLYFLANEYEAAKLRWAGGCGAPCLAWQCTQKDGCGQCTGAHARPKPTTNNNNNYNSNNNNNEHLLPFVRHTYIMRVVKTYQTQTSGKVLNAKDFYLVGLCLLTKNIYIDPSGASTPRLRA
jgi:hypothetical protein